MITNLKIKTVGTKVADKQKNAILKCCVVR